MREEAREKPPLMLTKSHEEILRLVHFYRFVGALDVCYALSTPGALTRVRTKLSRLAGDADYVERQYLYRIPLSGVPGNSKRVFTLGSRGREFLASHCGVSANWYFRPSEVAHFSHAHILHSLLLSRCLVSCRWFVREHRELRLAACRISYELARQPVVVSVSVPGGGSEQVRLIPDAWLLFERSDGKKAAILLEIDRGHEFQVAFKRHVAVRLEFIASGEYSRVFGTKGVTIAYVTTGERPEYRESRRQAICRWTRELLAASGRESWANVFRFCALTLDSVYETPLWSEPVWFRPDGGEPV